MKKLVVISALLLALAGTLAAATYWMMREPTPEWTTRSPAALKEFMEGLDDLSKVYRDDARRHFERAVELDSELAAAKVFLATLSPHDDAERLLAELEAVDLRRLNAQERFLVTYRRARAGRGNADPEAILQAFLDDNPENFFGLKERCDVAWKAQSWDEATKCHQKLLEVHPNWVQAQNRLGYIAMAQGRFGEAEEHFITYRYVAPDQANPYDSLAELLILLGRYEEAEKALREAARIKPDFCHVYELRTQLGLFSGRFERVEEALRDLESIAACGALVEKGFVCAGRAAVLYFTGDAEGAWRKFDEECLQSPEGVDLIAHRVAVMTGRLDRSAEMEDHLRRHYAEMKAADKPHARFVAAVLAHMEGIRALAAGDYPAAVEHLEEADELETYWTGDRASFKLFNRVNLLRALELAGETARATALRHKIESVNPRLLDDLRLPDLDAPRAASG